MRRRILITIGLLCAIGPASNGLTTIYSVGQASDCTHLTLQAALDAAKASPHGPHLIKLRHGTTYVFSDYQLTNFAANSISIWGGYSSCGSSTPNPDGFTTFSVSPSGGTRLFSIVNSDSEPFTVRFSRVRMNGNPDGYPLHGGLLLAEGHLNLELRQVELHGGRAALGGAIFIAGTSASHLARLTIDDSDFFDNRANLGGGIYCRDYGELDIHGSDFRFNRADGDGGAIFALGGCNWISIGASQWDDDQPSRFIGNRASASFIEDAGLGGAIFTSTGLELGQWERQTGRLQTEFSGNIANYGGAIAVVDPASGGHPEVFAYSVGFADNIARARGAAVHAVGRTYLAFQPAMEPNNRCQHPWLSDSLFSCLIFVGNEARREDGSLDGAMIHIEHGRDLFIRQGLFLDNIGGRTVLVRSTQTNVEVFSSIMQGNRSNSDGLTPYLFHIEDNPSLNIRSSTILDNHNARTLRTSGPMSIRFEANINANGSNRIWFNSSGNATLDHRNCLLADDLTGMPGIGNPGVIQAPAMIDPVSYSPLPGSPAIDVCDFYGSEFDYYGRPRGIDIPDIVNIHGPYDLGAVEFMPDRLYQDRFESP